MKRILAILLGAMTITGASAQVISNPGFETPAKASGFWDYTLAGTGWSSYGDAGLANGNSSWGRGAHSGKQYAFLQSKGPGAGISQEVSGFLVGRIYRIHFWMTRRNADLGGDFPAEIRVLTQTAQIYSGKPSNQTVWQEVWSEPFVAQSETQTFTFQTGRGGQTDSATLLDDISVELSSAGTAGQFGNPSFETPRVDYGAYIANPSTANTFWTGSNVWGIANGPGLWGKTNPAGRQFAYLSRSSSIVQVVSGLEVGQLYRVTFKMARRDGNATGNVGVPVSVSLNDELEIWSPTGPSEDGLWRTCNSDVFIAKQDSYFFRWQAADATFDGTSLLDAVTLQKLTRPPYIASVENPGFELPALAANTSVAAPTDPAAVWTGRNWGIANGAGDWGPNGSNSSQYAYVSSNTGGVGYLETTIDGCVIGQSYRIQFSVASPGGKTNQVANALSIILEDGTVLGSPVKPGTKQGAWYRKLSEPFVAKSRQLKFRIACGKPTRKNPDSTTLVDAVSIVKVPNP